MDVNISGRRISISDEVRETVTSQLGETIEKLKGNVIRADVEFTGGDSGSDKGVRVEITLRGKGPVVRATGISDDKLVAFDEALGHLKSQLRRAADRRKSRRGLRAQEFAAEFAVAPIAPAPEIDVVADEAPVIRNVAGMEVQGDGPLIVREKTFKAAPLTLEQALDEMEMVGHDFFLYVDAATGLPSVVYRRRAYDYGVLRLEVTE